MSKLIFDDVSSSVVISFIIFEEREKNELVLVKLEKFWKMVKKVAGKIDEIIW